MIGSRSGAGVPGAGLRAKGRAVAVVIACLVLAAGAWAQSVIYVDADATTGANDGSSWTDACADLVSALAAATSGDEIWVAEGTYKPTSGADRTISFALVDGVALYGGYAGYGKPVPDERDPAAHVTVLSGDIGIVDDTADNSYHVVVGASNATLDGFTITRGNANGAAPDDSEGAVDCNGLVGIEIIACRITANSCLAGAAVGFDDCSDVLLRESIIEDNSGGSWTVGINTTTNALVDSCVFRNNIVGYSAPLHIGDSIATVINSLFSQTDEHGTAVRGASAVAGFVNCIIQGSARTASQVKYDGTASFSNCVIWGNALGALEVDTGGSVTVEYSDIQGGYAGISNISSDPLFVDAASGDLHLQMSSPCIDTGDPLTTLTVDIEGNPRPSGSGYDMGAYEYQFGGSPPAAPSGLAATAASSSQINLSWTDNSTDEEDFELQRSDGAPGAWFQLQTFDPNTTGHSDTGLVPGMTYYYRVCARNVNGSSPWSNEASATTLGAPATSVTVTYPTGGEVFLAGSSAWVYWYAENITGDVEIVYTTDGGTSYTYAATVPAWQGFCEWTLPSVFSTQCRVKVWEPGGGGAWGESDDFTVVNTGIAVEPEVIEFNGMAGALGGVLVETFTVRYVARAVEPDVTVTLDTSKLPGYLTVDTTGFVLKAGEERSVTVSLDAPGLPRETSVHNYINAAIVADAAGLEVSSAAVDASLDIDPSRIVTGCAAAVGPPGTGTPGAALPCALLLLAVLARSGPRRCPHHAALPGRVRRREDAGKSPTCRGRLGSSGASGAAS